MAAVYNMPDHYKGDTFNEISFTINKNVSGTVTPVDLTGATIKIHFRKDPKDNVFEQMSTIDSTINIFDPTNGKFKIVKHVVDYEACKYYYDIQITYQNGDVQTPIRGNLKVIQDVTYI